MSENAVSALEQFLVDSGLVIDELWVTLGLIVAAFFLIRIFKGSIKHI